MWGALVSPVSEEQTHEDQWGCFLGRRAWQICVAWKCWALTGRLATVLSDPLHEFAETMLPEPAPRLCPSKALSDAGLLTS